LKSKYFDSINTEAACLLEHDIKALLTNGTPKEGPAQRHVYNELHRGTTLEDIAGEKAQV